MEIKTLVFLTFLLCFAATLANAYEGLAVYHTHNTPSACFGNRDDGPYITGVSAALWNRRGACGRAYRVTCIGGANLAPHPCKQGTSVVVKVTDFCASCAGDLNLSQEAFNSIADLRAGKIRVRYDPL